jgi:hypothetical protein
MKYCNSAFNAQGSRGIKIAVDEGIVKIYVAAMEALRQKERQGETQFTKKTLMIFLVSPPPLSSSNVNVLVCRFSHPVHDPTQGSGAMFSSLY